MSNLGYAGSSANPLARSVEGSMPGSIDAAARVGKKDTIAEQDRMDVDELNSAIDRWREDRMVLVQPVRVVPDFTNRAQTGISVEHAHFVAASMRDKGFQKRVGGDGHDVPVVIRESGMPGTLGTEALEIWKTRISKESGFPPCVVKEKEPFFCSLGNGHFFQALNLIGHRCRYANMSGHYAINPSDRALQEAISAGVPSIVLSAETPRKIRARISELLNSKHEFRWVISSEGDFKVVDTTESSGYISQFERIAKVLDAQELDCLVRYQTGVTDSGRIGR